MTDKDVSVALKEANEIFFFFREKCLGLTEEKLVFAEFYLTARQRAQLREARHVLYVRRNAILCRATA